MHQLSMTPTLSAKCAMWSQAHAICVVPLQKLIAAGSFRCSYSVLGEFAASGTAYRYTIFACPHYLCGATRR